MLVSTDKIAHHENVSSIAENTVNVKQDSANVSKDSPDRHVTEENASATAITEDFVTTEVVYA